MTSSGAARDRGEHRVICGDCLDPLSGLASLPDKSVDHAICDPPYSEHVHRNGRRGATLTSGHGRDPGVLVSQRRPLDFVHIDPVIRSGVAFQFARIVRRWVVVFADLEGIYGWERAFAGNGLEYIRAGIWVREGCTPQFSGDRPAAACEAIVIGHASGRKRWNAGGKRGIWTEPIVKGDRIHTTQKPLALMEALVRDFTDPGELICDPFAGSGTTGVACKRLGRRFVGWERDAKYHAIAEKRIAAAREQFSLLEKRGPEPKQASFWGLAVGAEGER